ncbi:STAS domain-containing protein [Nocardioides jiangxiensis]|uniref:STAS domain-containing protein n=1 Tax=Nocardioides jiangxiensis TaxID=3064524 RepID=A0ABT9AXV8_9ACTN|nr:STAS domain-containing protein [Nocardioides sp. WY-20]MDO7867309.1 STAS domain-containing protein [Nocardioides sp. WY-20]
MVAEARYEMGEVGDEVLELSGSLDARSTPEIRTALQRLLDVPGRVVVLDLGAVTSADVVALRVIAAASRLSALRGGRVVLRGVPDTVRRLLTVSRLARLVEIERVPGAFRIPQPRGDGDVASATRETT